LTIACIGWGSLIWKPGGLPIEAGWNADGPELSIEFARQSSCGRITLVVSESAASVQTLWSQFRATSLEQAREALQQREETVDRFIGSQRRDGLPGTSVSHRRVHAWLQNRELDAAVWADLPPKWAGENGKVPTEDQVLEHLRSLVGWEAMAAEEYVRRAPVQIQTRYRRRVEQELGWTSSD
jgi:hypothetical protein